MTERKLHIPPEQFAASYDAIVEYTGTLISLSWFREIVLLEARPKGTGIVVGTVVDAAREKEIALPLGIITPDGKAYSTFREIPISNPQNNCAIPEVE